MSLLRTASHLIRGVGVNRHQFGTVREIPKFFASLRRWKSLGGTVDALFPILNEASTNSGTASGEYFHQDLLVARKIFEANPRRHIDVGSRVDGFVAHVAVFREIEEVDIRPLPPSPHRIVFRQADLMNMPADLIESADSVSSLHAIEHFGLGRYGDPLDVRGQEKGFSNLVQIVEPGGTLYVSFPIGPRRVEFNAQRIVGPMDVFGWDGADKLTLVEFHYIDEKGRLIFGTDPSQVSTTNNGCGVYIFQKLL